MNFQKSAKSSEVQHPGTDESEDCGSIAWMPVTGNTKICTVREQVSQEPIEMDAIDENKNSSSVSTIVSDEILNKLSTLASNTQEQTENCEKLQGRILKAKETLGRLGMENQELRRENVEMKRQIFSFREENLAEEKGSGLQSTEQYKFDGTRAASPSEIRQFVLEKFQDEFMENGRDFDEAVFETPSYLDNHAITDIQSASHDQSPGKKLVLDYAQKLLKESCKFHKNEYPILPALLDVSTLMEFKLNEMKITLSQIEVESRDKQICRAQVQDAQIDTSDLITSQFSVERDVREGNCIEYQTVDMPGIFHVRLIGQGMQQAPTVCSTASGIIRETLSVIEQLSQVLSLSTESAMHSSQNFFVQAVPEVISVDPQQQLANLNLGAVDSDVGDLKNLNERDGMIYSQGDICRYRTAQEQIQGLQAAIQKYEQKVMEQTIQLGQQNEENANLLQVCSLALKISSIFEEIVHDFESLPEDNSKAEHKIQELENIKNYLEADLGSLKLELANSVDSLNSSQSECSQLKNELTIQKSRLTNLETTFVCAIESALENTEQTVGCLEVRLNEYNATTSKTSEYMAVLEKKIEIKTNRIQELEKCILSLNQTLSNETRNNSKKSQELEELEKLFASAEEKNQSQALALEAANARVNKCSLQLTQLQCQLRESEDQRVISVQHYLTQGKKVSIRNENLFAIVLLFVSILSFWI